MDRQIKASKMELRAALLRQGITLSDFADRNGFKLDTVNKVIQRYWAQNKEPKGKLTKEILGRLNNEIASQR